MKPYQDKQQASGEFVKVTRIGRRWHCRYYRDNKWLVEVFVDLPVNIGYACRQMMRMVDKCCGSSRWTSAARRDYCRNNRVSFGPVKGWKWNCS